MDIGGKGRTKLKENFAIVACFRIRLPPSVLPGKGTKAGRYRKRREELDNVYESLQMKKSK